MRKAVLYLFLLSSVLGRWEDMQILRKPAELIMADEIACKTGVSNYELSGEIRFQWDEPTPLTFRLWKRKGWTAESTDKADHVMGKADFFDDEGKRVQQWSFVTVPPSPTGEVVIQPGERRRFSFFVWNQFAQFPRPGKYYVIATFTQWQGKTMIIFTTSKRWFRVVEAPPDPKKEKL